MANENEEFFRPVVHPIDIQRIIGCSEKAAKARYGRYKKRLNKGKDGELTHEELSLLTDIPLKYIIPVLKKYPIIKILIAACLLTAFVKVTQAVLNYSCEFFRTHKMIWEEKTPTYLKGHTFIYDSTTHTSEKVTIEIIKLDK
ncbi:MAG TPA: hypothetical protein VJ647_00425 [Chitinophagaceae bacterium]|nr:hypothetical protein [Chitinophagaceae bacterium]